MINDLSENSNDVTGADGSGTSVERILAKIDSKQDPNITKALNKSQLSLPTSLSKTKKDADRLQSSIEKENARLSAVPKEEIVNEIMRRLEADAIGDGNINLERIHEIGVALINNFCSIDATADQLGMNPARLKHLIITSDELQVYYEIAHTGIKSLTDKEVIDGLKRGDEKFVKMVFQKMYAGRNKGGYNIAEMGTMGYDDPLAQKIAAATEDDRRQSQVKVEFNFVKKEVRENYEKIESADNVVDGDYEMVGGENEDNQESENSGSDSQGE
jgi:hypothetical protein